MKTMENNITQEAISTTAELCQQFINEVIKICNFSKVRGNSGADLRLENLENRALSGEVTRLQT